MNTFKILPIILFLHLFSCTESEENKETVKEVLIDSPKSTEVEADPYLLKAKKSSKYVLIDGKMNDVIWKNSPWYPLANTWLGGDYDSIDFKGRFKLAWDDSKLYLLTEIQDDYLIDIHESWDDNWWNDDCVEIFLDEDNGDDLHQFNHKAFAYHVALNTKDVVDLGPDEKPHLYNDHIICSRATVGNTSVWEFAIDIYSDNYIDGGTDNTTIHPL